MVAHDLQLVTDRLVLRLPKPEDFDPYAEMMGDEEAAKHIGGFLTRAAAWRKFLQMPGAWWMQGFAMFSVMEKSSGRWLGQVGPWQPEGWPGTEVGWAIKRDAWGKGYAREAAVATIDWAFANLGWTEVIHSINPENMASRMLAERLGSRILRQQNLPAPYQDSVVDIWGQSREEWFARHREAAA
ncbi:MAG: GNAT family N-acetyltransferase [Rudaea sp.]